MADIDSFLDFLKKIFIEQPRELIKLAKFDDSHLAPANYEAEHRLDSGNDRGGEVISLSTLKYLNSLHSLNSRSSRSSILRKGTSTLNFAHPKRSVYQQRPPPTSNSTFQYNSMYHAMPDSARTIVPVGSMRYISDFAARGEDPMIYDRPQTMSIE
jgi:hypothetical protein